MSDVPEDCFRWSKDKAAAPSLVLVEPSFTAADELCLALNWHLSSLFSSFVDVQRKVEESHVGCFALIRSHLDDKLTLSLFLYIWECQRPYAKYSVRITSSDPPF